MRWSIASRLPGFPASRVSSAIISLGVLRTLVISAFVAFTSQGCHRTSESPLPATAEALLAAADTEGDGPQDLAEATGDGQNLLFQHDFGIVRPHERVAHSFLIHNRSARRWTLRRVGRTCVCTVAKCPDVILPGSEAEIEIEYRASGAMADDRRALEVNFNETDAPILRFEVRVAIRAAAAPSVKDLVFRGTGKNYRRRQTFQVENFSGGEWTTVTAAADAKWASARAELSHIEQSASGPRQVWDVMVDADGRGVKPGRHGATLELHSGGELLTRLPIYLDLSLPLTASPERIFFGNLDASGTGECVVRLICAERPAEDALKALTVRHDLGDHLKLTIAPRGERILELKAVIELPAGMPMVHGTAVVECRDDDGTRIELPVSAGR